MSKPNKKRYKLSQVVSEAREKHPQIEIETDDGQLFTIDPPELWSDKAIDPNTGPTATGVELMGEERWGAFIAAGGSFTYLNLCVRAYGEEQGIDMGKSLASAAS